MPAPKHNTNSLRHGLTAVGKLPAGCAFVGRHVNQFRRGLEKAVLTTRGQITVADAAGITLACRWEKHSLLASRWLAEEYANLSIDDRLKFSGEAARATSARDNAVGRLGIVPPTDAFGFPIEEDGDQGNKTSEAPASPSEGGGGNAAWWEGLG